MSSVVERLIKYVKFDTKADENSSTVPSTAGQLVLAKELGKELEELGLIDISVDSNGYVMATLPANIDKKVPVMGFIAHMDTSPDMSGTNVNPKFIENYDGKDIKLNDEVTLSTEDFPELKDYIGETLITTDGTTLLGADDKAGIAEILTAVEYLVNHPEVPHGTIKIGFTPDEEVGRGPDHFDVKKFNADFAYTMDGGAVGELEYENFNAAAAKVTISGRNVHPGYAKNKMVNSVLIANEFISMMPENETPQATEGYEGFYHLNNMEGNVEKSVLNYIIRDFDMDSFENRKKFIKGAAEKLNKKYGNRVTIEIRDQYRNMKEKIEPVKYVVDNAIKAMEAANVKPLVRPIRGGTDGAQLSFKGLPTPNIFAGGLNFHGKYEYVPVSSMEKAVEVILKLVELNVNR
jgi:tripeptide aminopeptidase